jgi:hypothetical protein
MTAPPHKGQTQPGGGVLTNNTKNNNNKNDNKNKNNNIIIKYNIINKLGGPRTRAMTLQMLRWAYRWTCV